MQHQVSDEKGENRNRGQIMIVDYDRNPRLTTDQKLQSLIDSIQRALNELTEEISKDRKDIKELQERTE